MTYGMTCFDCDASIDVDLVNDDTARASRELENKAKAAGWGMGLRASGQAYYSCPDCAPGLFNFRTFTGYPPAPKIGPGQTADVVNDK